MRISVDSISLIQNVWVTQDGIKQVYLRYGSPDEPTWFYMNHAGFRVHAENQKELEDAYQRWVGGEE